MEHCIASPRQHRGAVSAEFHKTNEQYKGTFRYMNSMANGTVVDEFELISNLISTLPETRVSPTQLPTTLSPS